MNPAIDPEKAQHKKGREVRPNIIPFLGNREYAALTCLPWLMEELTEINTWPAVMHIENSDYTTTLFYTGPDGSEYAQDKAAGRLDRRKLTLNCKPKGRVRDASLGIIRGRAVLSLLPVMPNLTIDEVRRLFEDLMAVVGSATALEEFIESWFGPAGD